MGELLKRLKAQSPHYVRCLNPNSSKSPQLFDDTFVRAQVRYLGLALLFFIFQNCRTAPIAVINTGFGKIKILKKSCLKR